MACLDYFMPANPNCMCRAPFCKGGNVKRRNLARSKVGQSFLSGVERTSKMIENTLVF